MWLTLLKGIGFKGLSLLKSPWTWIFLLSLSTAFSLKLYRGAREDVRAAEAACEAAQDAARAQIALEAAQGWQAVVEAQQSALVRAVTREAEASAAARHWLQRFEDARKSSEPCARQAVELIACPAS